MVYRLKPVSKETEKLLVLARDEMLQHHHPYIGPEHLLFVLLRENSGQVATILARMGVNGQELLPEAYALVQVTIPARIRAKRYVPTIIKFMRLFIKPKFRFTRRAQHVIELAYKEARQEGLSAIEPMHLLAGIVLENDGPASQLLRSKGIDAARLNKAMKDASDISSSQMKDTSGSSFPQK